MLRTVILAALALALASPADARPRRAHHRHHHHAVVGRPQACAGIPWCGCWLRLRLGLDDAGLNLARAWARVGTAAAAPAAGVVAVWRHHVGIITGVLDDGRIMLLSGNDGNAVRERPRSIRGVIAFRRV
ncbi:hypothetical protein [Bradyrhizobium sp. SZCCHNR2012]|uniref:hypothetical protein n=1 Tax=Bradyrhizobium sp. SZCCHNR2012 TaxID=3057377 RepID=UPI0028E617E4|nr:hypothetical protein [Bradyrhizobium sp. SZCCHNR2012]